MGAVTVAGCDVKRSILFPSRFQTIPQITTQGPLPNGNINVPYSVQFTEAGGTYPFTWAATITPNTNNQFSFNTVTGTISGTPATAETETVTVTVSDSSPRANSAQATFTFAINTSVVITTSSLPTGTASVPYSFQLQASGGTTPYTWSMSPTTVDGLTLDPASGTLQGTPTTSTTTNISFTALDAGGVPSAPVSLTLTVVASGSQPNPPSAMWPSIQMSNQVRVGWWPPTDFNTAPPAPADPNTYNVYRTNGTAPFTDPSKTLVAPNVPPTGTGGGNGTTTAIQFYWWDDKTLSPSSTYTYFVTTVSPTGVESVPGPALTMTTTAGSATPPTPPAPVPDPSTWQVPLSIPTGTVWTATQNTAPNAAGTGTLGNTNCGLQFALANCNPLGGDLILVTAGLTYTAPNPHGFVPNDLTNATAWTYIVSTEAPEVGGTKLPAYVPYSDPYYPEAWTLTATLAIGATSATLNNTWTRKTGVYPVQFFNTAANTDVHEQRYVLFTQGSKTITWTAHNPCGIDGTVGAGLVVAAKSTISVKYLPGVTLYDFDNGALPILQGGGPATDGFVIQGQAVAAFSKLRWIGIGMQVRGSATFENFSIVSYGQKGSDAFWDRCLFGTDTSTYTTTGLPNCTLTNANWGWVHHGVQLGGANQTVHQCYFQGLCQPPNNLGPDSNAIFSLNGGPYCIEYCHIEAVSEGVIFGGGPVNQTQVPKQCTYRGNFNTKLQWWPVATQTLTYTGGTTGSTYNFTGDGTTKAFTITGAGVTWDRSNRWYVTLNSVVQAPSAYTMNAANNTINFITAPASGVAIFVRGQAQFIFGDNVKNLFECKVMNGANIYGNTHWNSWESNGGGGNYRGASFSPGSRDQTAANANNLRTIFGTNPWNFTADLDIHDNVSYRVQCLAYPFSCRDFNPMAWAGRIRIANNQVWMAGCPASPQEAIYRHAMYVLPPNGQLVDMIIENNTMVFDPIGCSIPLTEVGIYFIGPSIPTRDRFSIKNNIIPETKAVSGDGTINLNSSCFTNPAGAGWNNNVTIVDATGPFPAGSTTYTAKPYNTIGFKNFVDNLTPPTTPSDWNVVTNNFPGSNGAPVGATIGSTLAGDPFPRTFWQVIAPGGGSGVTYAYANATFQANAAKFNIVNPGAYMGIEQTMGNTTFATIFANIKAQAAANGIFPCRCILYTMSSEQSTVGGGGNGSTFTVWSATVNNANWWIRTSYPAGSIVTQDANSGNLAITSANSVTFNGQTIYQAFWNHYDGLYRQGTGVAQGYASNLSFAANPNLDGYQMDNVFSQPRQTGAWGMNTTSYGAGNATAAAFIQQGQALQIAALKALDPNLIVLCNADYFVHSTTNYSTQVTLDPSQVGIMDIVYCQSAIGGPNGIEGQTGTSIAQFMANLAAAEAQMASTGTLIFEQTGPSHGAAFSNANQASWTTADWQSVRYGQACCFMRNRHYALNFSENYSPTAPYFTDEMLQQNGKYGWLGQPVDPPQTAARTNGIWWRQFQNGVVFMNPNANGVQTLSLATIGLSGLSAIASNGFGDATVNNGAPVTSITLQARDGRFLKSF